ncbi:MAG: isoprenylcysteine carboxylmethyltransferase family protein [Gammaproteobacteria bacterium]|nr:isoprenylcysteine carboxylmethyltransferase family protein [Gammaproteobacteria bacterium]
MWSDYLLYGFLWFSFGAIHSLLARPNIQARLKPLFGSSYRLSYNVFSVFHLGVVFFFGWWLLSASNFSVISQLPLSIPLGVLQILGLVLIIVSLRQYDLGRFSGITQLRKKIDDSQWSEEPLNTQGLNGWVRHPLYTGAFMFLWGGAGSPLGLSNAVFGSIYLVIGAHFEERKLISIYGNDYVSYKDQVPAFFSLKVR